MALIGFGIIALWAALAYLMLAYLFKRIRHGIQEKPRAGWYFITVAIALFSLAWVLVLLLALYGFAYWAYTSIRNYHGYCTYSPPRRQVELWDDTTLSCYKSPVKEDLRGRRFTMEERLDIAINYYMCNQISMDYIEIENAEGMREASMNDGKQRFTLIPYSSKEEFVRENPDCCKLLPYPFRQDILGHEIFLWGGESSLGSERANGMGDGIFDFKRKVRYMDREGSRKEINIIKRYIAVSNCGYPNKHWFSETPGY